MEARTGPAKISRELPMAVWARGHSEIESPTFPAKISRDLRTTDLQVGGSEIEAPSKSDTGYQISEKRALFRKRAPSKSDTGYQISEKQNFGMLAQRTREIAL